MPEQLDYSTISEIFGRFHVANPKPEGELEYVNVFTLLVAVTLSAQATDKSVNAATRVLFALADTPEKILALGESRIANLVKTIGLYRNKAKNVIRLCEMLIEKFDGAVPASRAALQLLPGVGRKTANVVLNVGFGFPAQAVDTHIFRVGNRTGIAKGKDVAAVERALEDHIPVEYQMRAHHWLILHGRHVCQARKPICGRCIINDLCTSEDKV